jgi:hypothetical protein
MTYEDIKFGENKPYISLSKLVGKEISDIQCRISMEFGSPSIVMFKIVFKDGSGLYCEGEHDFPFVTNIGREGILPSEEELETIYDEIPD